jgi:hypothetical protein
LSPCIDNIDANTMKYFGTGGRGWGIFKWSLTFSWTSVPQRILTKINNSKTEPYPSPTHAGGLLAAGEFFRNLLRFTIRISIYKNNLIL